MAAYWRCPNCGNVERVSAINGGGGTGTNEGNFGRKHLKCPVCKHTWWREPASTYRKNHADDWKRRLAKVTEENERLLFE